MASQKNEAAIDIAWMYLRAALISVAIGPPIASYFIFLSLGLSAKGELDLLKNIFISIPLSMVGWPIAYILGTVPAALGGALYVATVRIVLKGSTPNLWGRILLGALLGMSIVYIFQLVVIPGSIHAASKLPILWISACIGAIITAPMRRLA